MIKRFNRVFILSVLLLGVGLPLRLIAASPDNQLPADVVAALHDSKQVVLYSLESWAPSSTNEVALHHFKVLGQAALDEKQAAIAVQAFEAAVSPNQNGGADCFNPRYAIRVQTGKHTYDFLLCYGCHWLYVYRDNEEPKVFTASGSPKVLNDLLKAVHLPVLKTDE